MTRPLYVPPTGDDPLDAIEWAIVHALVPAIAAIIRQQLIDEQQAGTDAPPATTTDPVHANARP